MSESSTMDVTYPSAEAHANNIQLVVECMSSSSYPARTYFYQVPPAFRVQKTHAAPCTVCRRTNCTLTTHRRYHSRRTSTAGKDSRPLKPDLLQTSFVKSYAWDICLPDPSSSASYGLNGLKSLPIPGGESPALKRSVWHFLTTFLDITMAIPRPSNMPMNDIGGAYLMPAFTNPAVCYSILAMDAAIKAVGSHDCEALSRQALRYQHQSLTSMRQDTSTVGGSVFKKENALSLCILWGKETATGTPESVRDYAHMVRSTIDSVGGLSAFGQGDATAQAIMWVDMNTACCFEEDIWFKEIPAPPPPPMFFKLLSSQSTLPPVYSDALTDDVRMAAINFRTLLLAKQSFTSKNTMTMRDYRFFLDSINHNNMVRLGLENVQRNTGTVSECVTVAMNLLHFSTLFGSQANKMTNETMINRLGSCLDRYGDVNTWILNGSVEVLLWICFVAGATPAADTIKAPFISIAVQCLDHKYGSYWPLNWNIEILTQLKSFLWLDPELLTPFSQTCQAIDAHVNQRSASAILPMADIVSKNIGEIEEVNLDFLHQLDLGFSLA